MAGSSAEQDCPLYEAKVLQEGILSFTAKQSMPLQVHSHPHALSELASARLAAQTSRSNAQADWNLGREIIVVDAVWMVDK